MIYHISRGAPKSTKPKIKETLGFYKRFRANVRGTATPATDGGGAYGHGLCGPASITEDPIMGGGAVAGSPSPSRADIHTYK